MTKKLKITNEEVKTVYDSIEDYIFENHKLCSINEIISVTGIYRKRCTQIIEFLIKDKKIKEIYGGVNKVSIYIPSYMIDEILNVQVKPRWVDEYSFDEKKDQINKIKTLKEGIKQFEMFERLIYTTNTPLEEAVAFALNFLEFDDVKHLKDRERHDVEFKYNSKLYLVEIKGKGKYGDKDDILQLGGWIQKKLDEGMERDELEGLFVINHYRRDDPKNRGDSLTKTAKQYLKHYNNSKFIETIFLFDLIKKVLDGKLSKDDVRKKIAVGQKY